MKDNTVNTGSILTVLSHTVRKIHKYQARLSQIQWSLWPRGRNMDGMVLICEAASFYYFTLGFFSVATISASALGWWEWRGCQPLGEDMSFPLSWCHNFSVSLKALLSRLGLLHHSLGKLEWYGATSSQAAPCRLGSGMPKTECLCGLSPPAIHCEVDVLVRLFGCKYLQETLFSIISFNTVNKHMLYPSQRHQQQRVLSTFNGINHRRNENFLIFKKSS